jgi:hypothetical protein
MLIVPRPRVGAGFLLGSNISHKSFILNELRGGAGERRNSFTLNKIRRSRKSLIVKEIRGPLGRNRNSLMLSDLRLLVLFRRNKKSGDS